MRRLAKTFRKDDYTSYKDYQELKNEKVDSFIFSDNASNILSFDCLDSYDSNAILAIGGYIFTRVPTSLSISLLSNDETVYSTSSNLNRAWNRIGFCIETKKPIDNISIRLAFNSKKISIWGLSVGLIDISNYDALENASLEEICSALNLPHLIPESFYLEHNNVKKIKLNEAQSSSFRLIPNNINITLKKCCYCQRILPVSPLVTKSSFHKHRSKKSGFQNECRSCKKWRINDFFNPDRSSDKLNESSIITREKKILLKEPEQIILLKDRTTGEGLKSQVWKRFNQKCFNCEESLELNQVNLDHTRPLAYLWAIDKFATCLCSTCNNNKHDSFPVDFYTDEQLHDLSRITGLSYVDLIKKDVCEFQLERMLNDISHFAQNLDPRTFLSIAQKVKEVRPNTDLFSILKDRDIDTYNELLGRLKERKE